MVVLAVSTGLRCCDIVALRLDEIDWRRDEIRLVQAKTSSRWYCRCRAGGQRRRGVDLCTAGPIAARRKCSSGSRRLW